MSYWNRPFVEFCPSMFCPFNCDVCPQEQVREHYEGNALMDYKTFKECLFNVPKNIDITFAGYSEPFINPDFVSMLILASQEGYKIGVFTTLKYAKISDIGLIKDIDFEMFRVHLPDGKHLKFQYSSEYGKVLHYTNMNIKNVSYITMTNEFVDCGNVKYNNHRRFGKCLKFDYPQFQVLPDGNVLPCCQTIYFDNKNLGNLKNTSYDDLVKRYYLGIPMNYCHDCINYTGYKRYLYLRYRPLLIKLSGKGEGFE